jgi:thermostable 8-oxoguanine DNA glycosylase
VKHRIKETAAKYIKYLETFLDEIETLEKSDDSEKIKEALIKRYGKDAPGLMGPWLKLKGLAATHISRYKNLASSKTPTVPPSTKTP